MFTWVQPGGRQSNQVQLETSAKKHMLWSVVPKLTPYFVLVWGRAVLLTLVTSQRREKLLTEELPVAQHLQHVIVPLCRPSLWAWSLSEALKFQEAVAFVVPGSAFCKIHEESGQIEAGIQAPRSEPQVPPTALPSHRRREEARQSNWGSLGLLVSARSPSKNWRTSAGPWAWRLQRICLSPCICEFRASSTALKENSPRASLLGIAHCCFLRRCC